MNKYVFMALAFLVCGAGLIVPATAQTDKEIQEKYTTFLHEKNLFSKVDEDGDIQFKYDDKTFFLDVDQKDPNFFRLVLANIWPIESEEERERALQAMDIANRKVKVAKMYMVQDNIWVCVEGFQYKSDDYEAYFDRSLDVIVRCVKYYKEAMNG